MNTDRLRPGDILVFEAEGGLLSEAIALLTRATVSHSAMVYTPSTLVEMAKEGGIGRYQFFRCSDETRSPNSRAVHVLRLEGGLDMAPVLSAASGYLAARVQYNMPLLVLLGGVLVYRRIPFTGASWPFVRNILLGAVRSLEEWANRGHGQAMVCSQLTYQCYLDAGARYAIGIERGNLQGAAGIHLAALLEGELVAGKALPEPEYAPPLYDTMLDDFLQSMRKGVPVQSASRSVVEAAQVFHGSVRRITREAGVPLEAMFVTPGDLLHSATNLKKVGAMRIKW